MSSSSLPVEDLSLEDAAQVASLDAVRHGLVAEAKTWAARIGELSALAARADRAGAQTRRTLALELAGSWQISQLTAERWLAEAERFYDALPLTLSMLSDGSLLAHQAKVLLHKTLPCTAEVASAVEREVLPAGSALCPSDLSRRVDRVRLRIESEQADPADAERQEAEKVGSRRTWMRPTEDGMALAGAILTPEQGAAWAAGMDALERRERLADRAAGIDRTAEQRRADLFAALPALVLAGIAQDDAWRRAGGLPTGGRVGATRPGETEPLFDPSSTPGADRAAVDLPPRPGGRHHRGQHPRARIDGARPVPRTRDRGEVRPGDRRARPTPASGPLPPGPGRRPVRPADRCRRRRLPRRSRPGAGPATDPGHARPSRRRRRRRAPARPVGAPRAAHRPARRPLLRPRMLQLTLRPRPPRPLAPRQDRRHEPRPGLTALRCHSAKHHGWTLLRHPDGSVTWNSPLRRRYDRPGPWDPPPHIDPFSEAPPLRRRPDARPPEDGDERSLLDQLQPSAPADVGPPPAAPPCDDDPPF